MSTKSFVFLKFPFGRGLLQLGSPLFDCSPGGGPHFFQWQLTIFATPAPIRENSRFPCLRETLHPYETVVRLYIPLNLPGNYKWRHGYLITTACSSCRCVDCGHRWTVKLRTRVRILITPWLSRDGSRWRVMTYLAAGVSPPARLSAEAVHKLGHVQVTSAVRVP